MTAPTIEYVTRTTVVLLRGDKTVRAVSVAAHDLDRLLNSSSRCDEEKVANEMHWFAESAGGAAPSFRGLVVFDFTRKEILTHQDVVAPDFISSLAIQAELDPLARIDVSDPDVATILQRMNGEKSARILPHPVSLDRYSKVGWLLDHHRAGRLIKSEGPNGWKIDWSDSGWKTKAFALTPHKVDEMEVTMSKLRIPIGSETLWRFWRERVTRRRHQ